MNSQGSQSTVLGIDIQLILVVECNFCVYTFLSVFNINDFEHLLTDDFVITKLST
jgi:hypothetical protein